MLRPYRHLADKECISYTFDKSDGLRVSQRCVERYVDDAITYSGITASEETFPDEEMMINHGDDFVDTAAETVAKRYSPCGVSDLK